MALTHRAPALIERASEPRIFGAGMARFTVCTWCCCLPPARFWAE